MRAILLSAVLALSALSAPLQEANGSISGTVVHANTQRPMAGVLVQIQSVGVTTTDENGRFTYSGVRSGIFAIQALRTGMAPPLRDTSTRSVAVGPGEEVRNVRLLLAPFGTASGRITDRSGNAIKGVIVQAEVVSYRQGYLTMVSAPLPVADASPNSMTDEKGEYRLELPPGKYYLSATFRPPPAPGARTISEGNAISVGKDTKTYFPGTLESKLAATVTVNGGDIVPADFSILTETPGLVKVSGTISGRASPPQATPSFLRFRLVSRDGVTNQTYVAGMSLNRGSSTDRFQIEDVPRGSYNLLYEEGGRWAATAIEVLGRDLADVTLVLRPREDLAGRIVVTGATNAMPLEKLTVIAGSRYAIPGLDGSFTLRDLQGGSLGIRVDGLPPDAYVADIRQGSRSLYDTARILEGPQLEVGNSTESLQIVVNPNGGLIDGVIEKNEQTGVLGSRVVLVPAPSRRFVLTYYKTALANERGEFSFRGIAPGVYQIFAWESVPDTAWLNPEFMASYEGRGQTVAIDSGGRLNARVRLIPRAD